MFLSPEAIYGMEFGLGETDKHGRRRLSTEETAYAIAYALTDDGPDRTAAIKKAYAAGTLTRKQDVARVVRQVLDEGIAKGRWDSPRLPRIRRFFEEYFGYDRAGTVFKDNDRRNREGIPQWNTNMLVHDALMLIEYHLKQDQNVITLRPETLGVNYSELRLSESVHNLGHLQDGTASNGWTGHQARAEVEKLHLNCVAEMAKKLERIPEGSGTMLDNTTIVYMSCAGGDHHGGQADWPFILVGGMANKLRMGRYIEYAKYREKGHRTIANLYLSLMQAAGMRIPETFGQLDSNLKDLDLTGPLAELMVS